MGYGDESQQALISTWKECMARTRHDKNARRKTSLQLAPNEIIGAAAGIPEHEPAIERPGPIAASGGGVAQQSDLGYRSAGEPQPVVARESSHAGAKGEAAGIPPVTAEATDFRFYIDDVTDKQLEGWIIRVGQPLHRCVVALTEGGRILARAVASRFRADLVSAGIGDGHHVFAIPPPPILLDGEEHLVEVVEQETGIQLTQEPIRWRAGRPDTHRGLQPVPETERDLITREATTEVPSLAATLDRAPHEAPGYNLEVAPPETIAMRSPGHTILPPEYIIWAFAFFIPDQTPSEETIETLQRSCPTTASLRNFFLASAIFQTSHEELFGQLIRRSLRQVGLKLEQAHSEIVPLRVRFDELRARAQILNPDIVKIMEVLSTARDIAALLRDVQRRVDSFDHAFGLETARLRAIEQLLAGR